MQPASVRSVYVHAPFCARRCFYCDFAVHVRRVGDLPGWLAALTGELVGLEREGLFTLGDGLTTLYVGGGTPSILGADAMAGLRGILGAHRLSDPGFEWTAEANPESVTPDLVRAWRDAGVNRLSLGVQSFHAPSLRWMGRLHGPEGAWAAVKAARGAGITNVSVDLIFGLPGHLGRDWREDLDVTLRLDVPHVSLYGLGVEEATPLGRAVREGREPAVDEERYREEYLAAVERLTAEGYEHYEVSNFARRGMESRHNSVYWMGGPYLGLGNGAHSYAPPLRRWNVRDWEEYCRRATGGLSPEDGRETLGAGALALERAWLRLRTARGIRTGTLALPARRLVTRWIDRGLARADGERVGLTPEGWLVLDLLAVELDQASSG